MSHSKAYLICNEQKINLKTEETIIGRLTTNAIVINDPTISKTHSSIIYISQENKFYLCDLNTVNGTYLNGIRLQSNKKYVLKHKDTIQFGKNVHLYNFYLYQPQSQKKGKINLKDYCFQLESDEEQHKHSKLKSPPSLNKIQLIDNSKILTAQRPKDSKAVKIPNLADYLQLQGSLLSSNHSQVQMKGKQSKFTRQKKVQLPKINQELDESELKDLRGQEEKRKNIFLKQQAQKIQRENKMRALEEQKISLQIEKHKQQQELLRKQIEMEAKVQQQQKRIQHQRLKFQQQLLQKEQERRQKLTIAQQEQREKERRFVQQLQNQKEEELSLIRQQEQLMRTNSENAMREELQRKKKQLQMEAQALATQYEQIYKETIRKMRNDIQKQEKQISQLQNNIEACKQNNSQIQLKVSNLAAAVQKQQTEFNRIYGRNKAFILYSSELQNRLDKLKSQRVENIQEGKLYSKLKEDIMSSRKLLSMKNGQIKSLQDQISKIRLSLSLEKKQGLSDMLQTLITNHQNINKNKYIYFEYLKQEKALKQLWESELAENEHLQQQNLTLQKQATNNKKQLINNIKDNSSRMTQQRLHMLKCLHYLPQEKKRAAKLLIEQMITMQQQIRSMVNDNEQTHQKINELIINSELKKQQNQYYSQLLFGADSTAHHFDNMKIQINSLIDRNSLERDQNRVFKQLKIAEEIENNEIKLYETNAKLQKLKNRWRDGLRGQKVVLADKNPIVFFGDILSRREAEIQTFQLTLSKLQLEHNEIATQIEDLQRKKMNLSESLECFKREQLQKVRKNLI